MATRQYDPGLISIVFKGIVFQGVHSGTFVTAERDNPTFTKDTGAHGDVVRVRSRKRGGKFTVTLQATSLTNDQLSTIAIADENFGTGSGTMQLKDLGGNTLVNADSAWIESFPSVEFGDDHSPRQWTFDCGEMDTFIGGTLVTA